MGRRGDGGGVGEKFLLVNGLRYVGLVFVDTAKRFSLYLASSQIAGLWIRLCGDSESWERK